MVSLSLAKSGAWSHVSGGYCPPAVATDPWALAARRMPIPLDLLVLSLFRSFFPQVFRSCLRLPLTPLAVVLQITRRPYPDHPLMPAVPAVGPTFRR